jgi:hypothetical protein
MWEQVVLFRTSRYSILSQRVRLAEIGSYRKLKPSASNVQFTGNEDTGAVPWVETQAPKEQFDEA